MKRTTMMRIFLFILCPSSFILLPTSCERKGWIYREVVSNYPQFNSTQLLRVPDNGFNGIEVQFLEGEFGMLGFLSVYSRQIPSDNVMLKINECQYPFSGSILEGGQRILLPNEATQTIIKALLSGQKVCICIKGFATELCPENFSRQYKRFIHPQ